MEPERLKPQSPRPEKEPAPPRSGLSRPDDSEYESAPPASPPPSERGSADTRTPPPAPPRRTEVKKSGSGGKWIIPALLVAILAIGYFLFGSGGGGSSNALAAETQAPNYQKHKLAAPGASLRLSRSDMDVQATKAAIAAAQAGQAIPGMSSTTPELVQAIARGDVEIYTVRAYDTCAEDGDWVTIVSGNGARMGSVMITKAGSSFSIPVVGGQMPDLQLIADKDGVGGVTVGVQTSGGVWYSGVLGEGQSQPIPLAVR